MNIWHEIKKSFHEGNNLIKLIYVNITVFLLVQIVRVFLFLMNVGDEGFSLVHWLAVPASFGDLILKPWTVFTYMFLHEEFLHILFNMLWLFWFGRIFLVFLNQKQLLTVYLLGGLTGAAFFVLAFNIFPVFNETINLSVALGASASVMAVVFGTVTVSPNYTIQIPFLGPVKIKWIALIFIVMDIMQIPIGNAGGHIAHLGGAFPFLFCETK
ncbi:MAG: rhomboid family intramembrane serine protease [Bacteroidota bacterium]|nr:rhomboid family intramembrane serine protease [Bacteroidota bacterium]